VNKPEGFFIVVLDKWNPDFLPALSQKKNRVELVFVTSGYLIKECNFHFIRINSNDFHLSLAAQKSEISEVSPDIGGYYCCFDSSFYMKDDLGSELELIASFLFQYSLRLNNRVFQRLSANFDAIFRLYNEWEPDYFLIQAYLLTCVYEIRKLLKESSLDFYPAKAFSLTQQYSALLDTHIEQEQNITFYADELKITPNHLNKSVKSVTGKTAIQLLNETRLAEAKSHLKHTDKTISEIAYHLGFEDQSYFSRFFKKATNISPMEFRKRKIR
jgi:AraC-like DNA-binding protein